MSKFIPWNWGKWGEEGAKGKKGLLVLVSCQYGELHQHNDKFDPETKAEGLKISKSDSLGMNLTHGQSWETDYAFFSKDYSELSNLL